MVSPLLVDLVVWLHLAYAVFVISGYVLIPLGAWLGWRWVRGRRYRQLHLAAIALVAAEAVAGVVCPLTALEDALRQAAGLRTQAGTFIGRLAHDLLYYQFPPWTFTSAYLLLVALGIGLWWVVRPAPPRGRGRAVG